MVARVLEFPSYVCGNADASEVLVFLAGFPDDTHTGFPSLIRELRKDYLIVSLCIPGFETTSSPRKPWGYDFDELLLMMHRTVKRHSTKAKVTLVLHDWGSIVGMLYQNKYPETVHKLVVFDVGILWFPKLRYLFHMLLYQLSFAVLYLCSQLIHVQLANICFKLFLAALSVFRFLSPTPHDTVHRPFVELNVEMCYLYFYFYAHYLRGRVMMARFPSCPILYMYGRRKNVMYHSDAFLSAIDAHASQGSKQMSFDCGHWVQHHASEQVLREMKAFMRLHRGRGLGDGGSEAVGYSSR